MRIGIIGGGVVGSATARCFIEHVDEVRVYDSNPLRCTATLAETLDTDLVFVCLPTPQKADSLECDTQYVDGFLSACAAMDWGDANLVLKSTVPIGYTREACERYNLPNLVHSPEFLTARTSVEDAANPSRFVIGWPDYPNYLTCVKALCNLNNRTFLYEELGSDIIPDYIPPTYLMTSDESEFVKLFQNSFSAVKIASFNEGYSFAQAKGLDWQRCLEAILAGGWINPMHTQVPGPDGKFGFGGACLPKDVASLGFQLLQENLRADMTLGAYYRNFKDRK